MGLLDDLRIDIGDDGAIFGTVECPVVWCATVVTDKVYNKQADDTIIFVNPTLSGPTTINLEVSPVQGRICVIKDMKGDANVNPILVKPAGGHTIDSFLEFHITQRFQAIMITWNGIEWNII